MLGNATFACGVRSARERSFEACSETEVGGGLLVPEPRPLPPLALVRRHAPSTQTEP